jgi:hypothetical protein
MRVRREMPVGGCIPDILLVSFSSPPPTELWPSGFTYRHACVLAELRRSRALRRSTLATRLYETEERIAPLVNDLVGSRAIEERPTGALQLSAELRRLKSEVIAIEAKLSRWSEALDQAASYRAFADRVIVAMDAGLFDASDSEAVASFRRAGIGLCVVDRDGPRGIHSGRRSEQGSAKREYVCSSVLLSRTHTLWVRR